MAVLDREGLLHATIAARNEAAQASENGEQAWTDARVAFAGSTTAFNVMANEGGRLLEELTAKQQSILSTSALQAIAKLGREVVVPELPTVRLRAV